MPWLHDEDAVYVMVNGEYTRLAIANAHSAAKSLYKSDITIDEINAANICLMAAAPELLELVSGNEADYRPSILPALLAVIDGFAACHDFMNDEDAESTQEIIEECRQWVKKAKRVIAKATGSTGGAPHA